MTDERGDVFGPPNGSAGAELDRLGITPGTAALPPCAFADWEDGKNLVQTEKAGRGNVGKHAKAPFDTVTKQKMRRLDTVGQRSA